MSVNRLLHQAAAGAGGDPVYVDDVFSTFLYEGNGAKLTIANGIDLANEGGLVWIKNRDRAENHGLSDTGLSKYTLTGGPYAGEQAYPFLQSQSSSALDSSNNGIQEFTSTGFQIAARTGDHEWNTSGESHVSWTFRKQPGFFDIVTYTGTGDTTGGSPTHRNIPHNLGVAPGMIITKRLDSSNSWYTWHRGVADDSAYFASSGFLDSTANFGGYQGFATNANQTSTHFAVRQNSDTADQTNRLGATYVAYLFAHDAQDFGTDSDEAIIKCDTYTGNGSSTGPTVNLGFEPQFLLIKSASSGDSWGLFDSMRGIVSTGNDAYLQANASDVEYDNADWMDLTATGFQLKNSHDFVNGNGNTYIYMAIRRPHKPASEFAATDLFKTVAGSGNPAPNFISGFPVDMYFYKYPANTADINISSRLTAGKALQTNKSSGETTSSDLVFDHQNGVMEGGYGSTGQAWMWRRAPGFFDVVTYKGTNQNPTTLNHNLGVVPEMIWVKLRETSQDWGAYVKVGGTEYGYYGTNQIYVGLITSQSNWGETSPTATQFTVSVTNSNASYNFVAYLWASVPGISKFGTYSGTGSELTVDCGFSAGARFVLIKRIDSSMGSGGESWFVFDTVRGITASSSPYFPLNDTDAQASGSFVKPDSSGFKVTTESVVNTNGGTYMFYAIA